MEGHYFKPRIDRELLSQYSDGLIATTGCVGGEIQTRLRLGQYDEARQAAAEFQDIFGKENYFAEVMDHGLDIERQTQRDLLRLAKDLAIPLVATNDLHYTKRRGRQGPRGAALRPVRLDPDGPQPVQVRRRRVLPQDPRARCATCSASCPRPATTPCSSPSAATSRSSRARAATCRGSPARRARTRSPGSSRRSSAACEAATPRASRTYAHGAGALRDRRHPREGLRRLLPRRRRLHQLGQGQRHPGRSRSWLRCRLDVRLRHAHHRPRPGPARPDLRAVPQPRAPVDARLRRRLRRAPPRRGHPLRHARSTARSGSPRSSPTAPSRPSRRSRTPPGSWATPTRWARSSPRRCRRRSWARTCRCPACSTRTTRATTRRPSSAASTTRTRRPRRSSRPRSASRASSASGASTRPASS